ncbi:MAG TPA: putative quinol monooxygenase [Gaiellaceae bacterium]|nr:putative quinol monooxygenase [Gaiellaceae bacterium]
MIVLRFKVEATPDRAAELLDALRDVVAPARHVDGVVEFDIARDLTNPNAFVATEVFEDEAARARQESLPEVARVMELLPTCLAAPPEATVYHVASSEPAL